MKNRSTYDPEKKWARESLRNWVEVTPAQAIVFVILVCIGTSIVIWFNIPYWAALVFLFIFSVQSGQIKETEKLRQEIETLHHKIELLNDE